MIEVNMLVTTKSIAINPAVYVVLRMQDDGFAMVQSKDGGRVTFKAIDTLKQATMEEYRLYGYEFPSTVTAYNLTNFLIWIRSEGIHTADMTDAQFYELSARYIAFKEGEV